MTATINVVVPIDISTTGPNAAAIAAAGWQIATPPPPVKPLKLATYEGWHSGPGNAAFATAVGHPLMNMDFVDTSWQGSTQNTLNGMVISTQQMVSYWSATAPGANLIAAIGGLPSGGTPNPSGAPIPAISYDQAANGAMDATWTSMLNVIGSKYPNAPIRPFHEFNGGWFQYAAHGHQAGFIASTQRLYALAHKIIPGCEVWWNPTRGDMGVGDLWGYYAPGMADRLLLDVYDVEWNARPTAPVEFNHMLTQSYGLNWLATKAASVGLPIGIGECGVWASATSGNEGGGDDPTWVTEITQWARTFSDFTLVWWNNGGCALLEGNGTVQYPLSLDALKTALVGA